MTAFKASTIKLTRVLAAMLCLGIIGQTAAAWARFTPKPGRGRAKQRIGLASRGALCAIAPDSKPLTTIVPEVSEFTAQNNPNFTWFMPQHTYPSTEFRLMAESENGLEIVHRQVFDTLPKNQVVSYNLEAEGVAPLEQDTLYKWQVHLVCDPDMPSGNLFAEGWIEYEAPSASLQQQLDSAAESQKAQLWLTNGYWYEGIQVLHTQMQQDTTREAARQEWQTLMTDELVNLPHLATLPDRPVEEDGLDDSAME